MPPKSRRRDGVRPAPKRPLQKKAGNEEAQAQSHSPDRPLAPINQTETPKPDPIRRSKRIAEKLAVKAAEGAAEGAAEESAEESAEGQSSKVRPKTQRKFARQRDKPEAAKQPRSQSKRQISAKYKDKAIQTEQSLSRTTLTQTALSNVLEAAVSITEWNDRSGNNSHLLESWVDSMPREASSVAAKSDALDKKSVRITDQQLISHMVYPDPWPLEYQDKEVDKALKSLVPEPLKLSDLDTLNAAYTTFGSLMKELEDSGAGVDMDKNTQKIRLKLIALQEPLDELMRLCEILPITQARFNHDRVYASAENEAIFQRTVMMSIFDRCSLFKDLFAYSAEVTWKLSLSQKLPRKGIPDSPNMPDQRPDLLISFKRDALKHKDISDASMVDKSLSSWADPEGSKYKRCFPFLVFEAKRTYNNLEEGLTYNVYRAAQLLFNMFQWFRRADAALGPGCSKHRDIFHEKVRVFTLTLNAKNLIFRAHRIERKKNDTLLYRFSNMIVCEDGYKLEDAGRIVRTIVKKYAKHTLLGLLKDACHVVAVHAFDDPTQPVVDEQEEEAGQGSGLQLDRIGAGTQEGDGQDVKGQEDIQRNAKSTKKRKPAEHADEQGRSKRRSNVG